MTRNLLLQFAPGESQLLDFAAAVLSRLEDFETLELAPDRSVSSLDYAWRAGSVSLKSLAHTGGVLTQAEHFFNLLTETIQQCLFVQEAATGAFLYVSPAYEYIWQQSCQSLYADSTSWLKVVHPADLAGVKASLAYQFEGNAAMRDYRIVRPNGELRWIHTQVYVIADSQNRPSHFVGWSEDCTDRKQLQIDLQAAEVALNRRIGQERLLRTITAHMRETLDLGTVLATTTAEVNSILEADRVAIYQFSAGGSRHLAQQTVRPPYAPVTEGLLPPNAWPSNYMERFRRGQPYIMNDVSAEKLDSAIAQFLATLQVQSAMVAPIVQNFGDTHNSIWGVLVVHSCDHPRLWQPFEAEMLQHIADQLAIAIHQAALYQQLQTANQELERLSKTDGLTNLANRRCLDDYLYQEWQRLARQQRPLSVILADVDHFKLYNDTYGHGAGDQCLGEIARAIQFAIRRPADLAARYGGEEFAIVLPDTDELGAVRVVELVRQALQTLALPHQCSPVAEVITLSFGIATLVPQPNQRFDRVLEAADQALYQAKDLGRNQYTVFESPQ
ncbi:MAG: diguanylate cyclase domain-containing protein [Nodosilinea sp.]